MTKTSSAAQSSPGTDYLYDFVYLDRPRVASYIAQLVDEGVITSAKVSAVSGETAESQIKIGLAGSGTSGTDKAHFTNSIERSYDTTWSALVSAIDRLDELGYISDDITTSSLGQLVWVSGTLELLDIRMLKDIWPIFADNAAAASSAGKKQSVVAAAKKEAVMTTNLMTKLPHALQMSIKGEKYDEVWSTLDPAGLTINSDDFAFKHGASISGVWHVIGVLDALPEPDGELPFAFSLQDLRNGMLQMLTMLRTFFGRPATAYGITPIAIFRAIRK